MAERQYFNDYCCKNFFLIKTLVVWDLCCTFAPENKWTMARLIKETPFWKGRTWSVSSGIWNILPWRPRQKKSAAAWQTNCSNKLQISTGKHETFQVLSIGGWYRIEVVQEHRWWLEHDVHITFTTLHQTFTREGILRLTLGPVFKSEKNNKNLTAAAEAVGRSCLFRLTVAESELSHNSQNIQGDVPSLCSNCGKNTGSTNLKNRFFCAKREVFAFKVLEPR